MQRKSKSLLYSMFVLVVGIGFLTSAFGADKAEVKYQWEAKDRVFQNIGVNTACTLTTPRINRSRPIVLILHGYGGEHKGFPVEGTCESLGGGENEVTTFGGQVSDAAAALDFIETLPDPVDSKRSARLIMPGYSAAGLTACE